MAPDTYLRLVARADADDDRVLGTIRYWPVSVGGHKAMLLGPVAARPELKGKGIGKALIWRSLDMAAWANHRLVLLVGDLAYYGQFGFCPAHDDGLEMPGEEPARAAGRVARPGGARRYPWDGRALGGWVGSVCDAGKVRKRCKRSRRRIHANTGAMIDSTLIATSYNRIAQVYASRRDWRASTPHLQRLNDLLAEDSLILDLGCGAGLPVDRWLIDHGHRVIGLDISSQMLALARRNVPQATYEQRDMAGLKEAEYAVDAVVCFFALFHVDRSQHDRLLRCMRSYLPRDGLLLLTTGRTDWEGEEDFLGARMAWSHFDRSTNRSLIEDAGFEIVSDDLHRGNAFADKNWHPIFLARTR